MKDLRYFRQERASLGNRYPFARAERFNRDVRRLGVSADGLTVLDRFRILITEIGNAMGYVRMVRAGGQHFCVEAMAHVPDSSPRGDGADGTAPLSSSAQPESDLGDDARASAAALGRAVEQVAESLDAGDQYFSVLEKVCVGGYEGAKGWRVIGRDVEGVRGERRSRAATRAAGVSARLPRGRHSPRRCAMRRTRTWPHSRSSFPR